jgi:hypothetical protein
VGSESPIPAEATRLVTQGAARRRPAAAVGCTGFARRLPLVAARVREGIWWRSGRVCVVAPMSSLARATLGDFFLGSPLLFFLKHPVRNPDKSENILPGKCVTHMLVHVMYVSLTHVART